MIDCVGDDGVNKKHDKLGCSKVDDCTEGVLKSLHSGCKNGKAMRAILLRASERLAMLRHVCDGFIVGSTLDAPQV